MRSNDPQNPALRLTITGQVSVPAAFTQRSINLGQVTPGETIVRNLGLQVDEPATFEIQEVTATDPTISTEVQDQGEGRAPTIKVTIEVPEKLGRYHATVTALTNLDKPKSLPMQIFGQVVEKK